MIDLHMHSTASDGTESPSAIIRKCRKLGLSLSSITDHDTISGQAEAIAAARKNGVRYVTGAEFSAKHEGELHILGYGMDINNKRLLEVSEYMQESRMKRMRTIVERLNGLGKKITCEEVLARANGNSVGRPHIASVLLEKGYVSNFDEAFKVYLNEGGKCYVSREKLTQKETFDIITGAGGYPVVAHPKFINCPDLDSMIGEFKSMGLWGIEAYYPAHSDRDVERFTDLAERHGLYVTCGSDFHGNIKKTAIACDKRSGELLERSVQCLAKKCV